MRVELARRGWAIRELASRIGLNPRYVSNLLCGNTRSRIAELKINTALGMPIFETDNPNEKKSR